MYRLTLATALLLSFASALELDAEQNRRQRRNRDTEEEEEEEVTPEPEPEPIVFERGHFRSDAYQALDASDKLSELWTAITADDSVQPYLWQHHDDIFTQNAGLSYAFISDEMPNNRLKTAHTQGVVAQVRWVSSGNHPYTGIFATGTQNALVRLSETGFITEHTGGLHPSHAIKLLRNGTSSLNLFGMPNFTGSDSWDFFAAPFLSRVAPFDEEDDWCAVATIQKKLATGIRAVFSTGLAEIARSRNDGTTVADADVVSPWELEYTPGFDPADYNITDDPQINNRGNQVPFYNQLRRIPAGTTLFEVFATSAPPALGGTKMKIGEVITETALVTSLFGDERLFFQHIGPNLDGEFNPTWRRHEVRIDVDDPTQVWQDADTILLPDDDAEAEAIITAGIRDYSCPFAWLLNLV